MQISGFSRVYSPEEKTVQGVCQWQLGKNLENITGICYDINVKETTMYRIICREPILSPPSIGMGFLRGYLQNVKMNVSNATRKRLKDIKSLKSK